MSMLMCRFVWFAFLGVVAIPLLSRASDRPSSECPNIIFILADDLGYGDLSCYGQQNFATPRLDRMAAQGMRFTQHYAGSTVCAPSRACLLSGMHTGHVYMRANGPYGFRADPQDRTIASYLKAAGYDTAMIGKSGLSCDNVNARLPNEKGFDYFFGFNSHRRAHRYYPTWLWRNVEKISYSENHGKEGTQYSGDLFLKEVLTYLETHSSQPFFQHISLQQPHADLSVPDKWKQSFLGRFDEEPARGEHYRSEEHPKSTFAGMVTFLDATVGAILDKLDELGIADNTIVFFSSDNGAMSEGGWNRDYFNSSGLLRGGKRDLYEGGIRVPLIVRWPGAIEAGAVSDHVSAFWDFVPTICELAGIEPPTDSDGISMAPTLLRRGTQKVHAYLYWEFHEQGGKQAVRLGDWKGVRLNVYKDREGPIELYDLVSDLNESTNVASQHKDVVEAIGEIMRREHVPTGVVSFDSP